jgi:hypothetical protein
MAIIRKGDKKAERELQSRANAQSMKRFAASDSAKAKAGLSFISKDKTSITSDPSKIRVSKNESGKVSAEYRGKDFTGPVSGSAIKKSQERKKKTLQTMGAGVRQGGKVIKGLPKNPRKGK